MFTLGAFALIIDASGRILLNQRQDNQKWNLPGGHVEPGELPTEAVVRETLEETGLGVEVERLVGFYSKEAQNDFVLTFLCRVVSGELQLTTPETLDCRFFAISEIPSDIHAYHVWRILDAFKTERDPIFVHQTPQLAADMMENLKWQSNNES
ncbi:MAG: NUDIX domain-containing protein [Anaerolineales bacterium]|nr:NUDIX domain-containing protein [Anaerolineales bacterium]